MSWDIVGMGAVANVGNDPAEIFDGLCQGRDGRAPLRAFDRRNYRSKHAYEIDDRPPGGSDRPAPDRAGRPTEWLRAAIGQALAQAGLDPWQPDLPVLVGTTLREQRSVELWWREQHALDLDGLYFGPALREAFGSTQSWTVANACSASLYTLAMATDLMELAELDTVVVAGTDAITESAFGTLDRVQNESPQHLRAFDESHLGMLMGEGAAAVVIRRSAGHEAGHEAGQQALGRLLGVGINCDAKHPTAPDGDSIRWVVGEAHRRSGRSAADIDLVMLHGTGTPKNDETEASVMREVFADVPRQPSMTAVKTVTGHTLGGSGLLSLVTAVQALRTGLVPPVLGLQRPIPAAAGLDLVSTAPRRRKLDTAQVNSFGFGGINAVAVLEAVA